MLIIFVKNIILGKVKTRLAKTIGNENAFQVYKFLVDRLEAETSNLNIPKQIHFSDVIIEEKWPNVPKYVQKGSDIGERMSTAIHAVLKEGNQKVVLVGSDIPDLSEKIINQAFEELEDHDVVLGPAEDGGYYLIGMKSSTPSLFKNIEWSTEKVLSKTLQHINELKLNVVLLPELNDIDTWEDLEKSSISSYFKHYTKTV